MEQLQAEQQNTQNLNHLLSSAQLEISSLKEKLGPLLLSKKKKTNPTKEK